MVEPKRMSSATTGVMMEKSVRQDGTVTRLKEGGSAPAPRVGGAADPRLVELVRLLARRTARRWYVEMMEERGQPRS
jgi:hypothetical protein